MSTYQAGILCEDCSNFGLQNYLKPFYINLEEQIIKCESSRCMFPYLRQSNCSLFSDSKVSDGALNLDELIEESFNQIDGGATKSEPRQCANKVEDDVPIMFDFSTLFMTKPVKTEEKPKPTICATTSTVIQWKTEDVKSATLTKVEATPMPTQLPPKARISRCLSDVKSSSFAKKSNPKRSKSKRKKNESVLVIEPTTGKPMRPLDLIDFYMKKEPTHDGANSNFKKQNKLQQD